MRERVGESERGQTRERVTTGGWEIVLGLNSSAQGEEEGRGE